MPIILAADIGGTKSHLCLARLDDSTRQPTILCEDIYASVDFNNANELIAHFLEACPVKSNEINLMCLALPGVVTKDRCSLTNLDWHLEREALQDYFTIEQVIFINDFAAASLGILTLKPADYTVINTGQTKHHGIKVVTGAGTGLGLAWLHHDDQQYRSNATEGGHIDFAPTTLQQIALLKSLMKTFDHISYERLLSGEGLQRIYQFITQSETTALNAKGISDLAFKGDAEAQQSLELFVEIYGAYIGSLALLYQPCGGIYIAGGIAAKHATRMTSPTFKSACFNKGRMHKLVKNTPIYLVTNERLGLQGALWHAQICLSQPPTIPPLAYARRI